MPTMSMSLVQPVVTPVTALKTRARARPWKAACLSVLTLGDEVAVLLDEGDAAGKHGGHLALGAFDQDGVAVLADRVLDAGG